MTRWINRAPLLAIAFTLAACGGASTTTRAPTPTLPTSPVRFAEYQAVPLADPNVPAYGGAATPHSLDDVQAVGVLRKELQQVPSLGPLLAKQGFAVVPSGSSLFQAEYEGNTYTGWPVYVTTDAAYNAWHLAFDKILRDLEQKVLLPKLERLVTGLVEATRTQARALRATPLAGDATRAEEVYEVAAAELGLPVALGPLALKEKALIDAHDAQALSPLLGIRIDYSSFTPRGHYVLTPALTRYFVAMSTLGQLGFCLPGTRDCPGLEPARIAILASHPFGSGTDTSSLWHEIYDPTSFLVGLADDYTPVEVAAATDTVLGYGTTTGLEQDANVLKIVHALAAARPVRIDPQRASIRIMGTRFVTDSYLLDQLVYPHVGTEAKPRLAPSALDLAATLGSTLAQRTMDAAGAGAFAHYDSQVQSLAASVAARAPGDWGSTVYDAWLAALQPVFATHGKAFPDYMRSDAWAAKDLQSGLGSYTELKHDTILYAKQLVAEAGGEPAKANPRNWVEPDPVAFERLASAADLLQQGLAKRGLLTGEAGGLLNTEIDLFRFLGRIAGDELARRPLATVDNQRLRFIGDELSALWWRTSERSHPDASIPDQAAVVADIASGPKGVLEIATGRVETLYVVVPAADGGFELARGGVYSWYEFTSPPGVRLTDEAWRATLDAGTAPARPQWESVFRATCPTSAECSPTYGAG